MNISWAVIALSLVTTSVQAEECKTELNDNYRPKDLSFILNCLSKKITALEAANKATIPPNGSPASSDKSVQLQDNAFFSIYTSGYSITNAGINFSLSIKNKTNKAIYLAWENDSLIITDENGLSDRPKQTTMSVATRGNTNTSNYTTIGPGGTKPVSLGFKRDTMKGTKITLGGNIQQMEGDKHYYYSISWTVSAQNK